MGYETLPVLHAQMNYNNPQNCWEKKNKKRILKAVARAIFDGEGVRAPSLYFDGGNRENIR